MCTLDVSAFRDCIVAFPANYYRSLVLIDRGQQTDNSEFHSTDQQLILYLISWLERGINSGDR